MLKSNIKLIKKRDFIIYLHFYNLISKMISTREIFDMRIINVAYFQNE